MSKRNSSPDKMTFVWFFVISFGYNKNWKQRKGVVRLQQIEFKKNVEDKQSVCTFSLEREREQRLRELCWKASLCAKYLLPL